MLNIFIIGKSKIGKTPLGQHLSKKFAYQSISASEWIKARIPERDVESLTKASVEALHDDPNACVDFLNEKYDLTKGGFVIEGIRNPRDFSLLFQPDRDIIIYLHLESIDFFTNFEKFGLEAIQKNIDWMIDNSLLERERVYNFKIYSLNRLPNITINKYSIPGPANAIPVWDIDDLFNSTDSLIKIDYPIKENKSNLANIEIAPIKAWVEDKVLFDEDDTKTSWSSCTIFGLSIYQDHSITFNILLDNGAVFSYIPPHRIKTITEELSDRLDLTELVYHNCYSYKFTQTSYYFLNKACRIFFTKLNKWMRASYITTIDWYKGNELLHLMSLENGQLAFMPSHKILFSSNEVLPHYKKLHSEWKV